MTAFESRSVKDAFGRGYSRRRLSGTRQKCKAMLKQWLLQFCQALAGIGRVFACIQPATQPPGNTSPLLGRLAAVVWSLKAGLVRLRGARPSYRRLGAGVVGTLVIVIALMSSDARASVTKTTLSDSVLGSISLKQNNARMTWRHEYIWFSNQFNSRTLFVMANDVFVKFISVFDTRPHKDFLFAPPIFHHDRQRNYEDSTTGTQARCHNRTTNNRSWSECGFPVFVHWVDFQICPYLYVDCRSKTYIFKFDPEDIFNDMPTVLRSIYSISEPLSEHKRAQLNLGNFFRASDQILSQHPTKRW